MPTSISEACKYGHMYVCTCIYVCIRHSTVPCKFLSQVLETYGLMQGNHKFLEVEEKMAQIKDLPPKPSLLLTKQMPNLLSSKITWCEDISTALLSKGTRYQAPVTSNFWLRIPGFSWHYSPKQNIDDLKSCWAHADDFMQDSVSFVWTFLVHIRSFLNQQRQSIDVLTQGSHMQHWHPILVDTVRISSLQCQKWEHLPVICI